MLRTDLLISIQKQKLTTKQNQENGTTMYRKIKLKYLLKI